MTNTEIYQFVIDHLDVDMTREEVAIHCGITMQKIHQVIFRLRHRGVLPQRQSLAMARRYGKSHVPVEWEKIVAAKE